MSRKRLLVAAIYGRLSPRPDGNYVGTERQVRECRELCSAFKYTVLDTFIDNDASASNGKKRPAYDQLLAEVRAGRVDVIVAWHPDRLYRRIADLEELINVCEAAGTVIRTCRAGELDLSTPTGRMYARITGAVARHEIEHKTARWKSSVTTNRRDGKWSNARDRLFGYDRDGAVNAEEAVLVRRMSEAVLAGRSLTSIAVELNEAGVRTTRGNRWAPGAVRHLLLNPRIAGHATHKGEIVGQGGWKAVLSDDKWQQTVAALHPYRARPAAKAVLTRVVFCVNPWEGDECGSMMHSSVRKSRSGEPGARIYRCPSLPPYDLGCGKLTVVAEPVEAIVEGYAKERLDDPRVRAGLEAQRSDNARIVELRKQVDDLDAAYEALAAELRDAKGRTKAEIVAAMRETEVDLDKAREQLTAAFPALAPSLERGWPTDVESRNALIRLVVARVEVGPNPPPGGRRFNPDRVRVVPVEY